MAKETLSSTPGNLHRERLRPENSSNPDLLEEILQLRERLRTSEDMVSRHAIMLHEGDHRIKNSLQIVASLMALQANREASEPAREALKTAANRILSIARIHDALQVSESKTSVNLGDVLRTMCGALETMAGDAGKLAVVVEVQEIEAPLALAQPMALAVNELVVNALRHAFPDNRRGMVRVTVAQVGDAISITVADDGIGIPDGYLAGAGYGLKLVAMVTKQVGGELHVETNAGSQFHIRAPLQRMTAIDQPDLTSVVA